MKAPVFSTAPTVSAVIREHRGRYVAAPFDADGRQTGPTQDFGPVEQHPALVVALVQTELGVLARLAR